jgi:hypothetical protein
MRARALAAIAAVACGIVGCGGESGAPAVPQRPASTFGGRYGARPHRCAGEREITRGGFDLRVVAIGCRAASRLVLRYAAHPANRLESLGSFGCYSYPPGTGLAAQRIVCIDGSRARAFRFDIG